MRATGNYCHWYLVLALGAISDGIDKSGSPHDELEASA